MFWGIFQINFLGVTFSFFVSDFSNNLKNVVSFFYEKKFIANENIDMKKEHTKKMRTVMIKKKHETM